MASQVVGWQRRAWSDGSRTNWSSDGPRPLAASLWYPAAPDAAAHQQLAGPPDRPLFRTGVVAVDADADDPDLRRPLVVLSHGTGGSADQLGWLATALAASGIVVGAVDHHGNTAGEAYRAEGFLRYWERARDLSTLIDLIIADPFTGPIVDPSRAGAAGFSLGGMTALLVAGATTDLAAFVDGALAGAADPAERMPPEFGDADAFVAELRSLPDHAATADRSHRDPRILAAFGIAPALGAAFRPSGLSPVTVPVELVVGSADELAPAEANAEHLATHLERASVTVLDDVGHYTFLAEPTEAGRQDLPLLATDHPSVDRAAVHRTVAARAVTFFGAHLTR